MFIGGAVTFINGTVIFIGKEAIISIKKAITSIGKGSSAIERLFKTARVRVGNIKGVNKYNLR